MDVLLVVLRWTAWLFKDVYLRIGYSGIGVAFSTPSDVQFTYLLNFRTCFSDWVTCISLS